MCVRTVNTVIRNLDFVQKVRYVAESAHFVLWLAY